jgi:sigma-B regulation protein RsbU (phosphoserine phosphatase)
MNVLLVDDARDTRDLFSFFLKMEGFSTQTAEDGLEAVAAVRESLDPFDVVVLDVGMPRMDGWEALRAIRGLPQGERLPVIMFSAHADDLGRRAADAGANDTLAKPAAPTELVEKIRRLVEQRQNER